MFQPQNRSNRSGLVVALVVALLIFVFMGVVIITAVSMLTGQNPILAGTAPRPLPRPGPTPIVAPLSAVTPNPAALTAFRSVALGVEVEYPVGWRRKESSLRVVFAPSPAGLEPNQLTEPVIWVGIPADNKVESGAILADILAGFPPNTKPSGPRTSTQAGFTWTLTDLSFVEGEQAGLARVAVTSHNEVGYYLVAVAPAAQWPEAEAVFQETFNRFRFTQEAVIRPTDATQLPTPTASPTPRIYIVQSGDTLGGIAVQFEVSIEALMIRNGLEDPRSLRSGQKLIIPNKKK